MFFRFPLSRVAIAAPPKTGCTSVLTFLTNLEIDLESREGLTRSSLAADALGAGPEDSADRPNIHVDKRLKRFAVTDRSPVAPDELRLATVRDPAERIASCWLDKIVEGPSVWQAKYYAEPWFPQDFRTPEAIEASFLAFLDALKSDPGFLHADLHWAPVSWLLRHWQGARWIATTELNDLPAVIIERLGDWSARPTAVMPHMHRTEAWLKPFLLTSRAQSLINEVYADDYDLLRDRCGIPSTSHVIARMGFHADDVVKLPAFDREVHVRRSRRLSESLAGFLGSAIWKRLVQSQQGHDGTAAVSGDLPGEGCSR
jgi:hypothetical protein